MHNTLETRFAAAPVVPLVQADDPAVAVATARALAAGGLSVIEVVLRTDAALDCLRAITMECDDVITGAGTVLTASQAYAAREAGAEFIISPGIDDAIVGFANEAGVPVYPGTYTPTDLMRAVNLGLDTVKFFPAAIAGGVPALKALSSVFRDLRFMPTGGVSAANLAEYLAVPAVVACGGTWLTPADKIAAGDYAAATTLAHDALAIATAVRG
ncbi:MAG: bifunctional 4-hydroxy-2-oxoglutarate aldolase/2-dehydro-3-deoxy-phosphogluconate aldolase [Pseudomonadota bacterium]